MKNKVTINIYSNSYEESLVLNCVHGNPKFVLVKLGNKEIKVLASDLIDAAIRASGIIETGFYSLSNKEIMFRSESND